MSELLLEKQKNGLSLALCQTAKSVELLETAEVFLITENLEKAIQSNQHLEYPSIKPIMRHEYFVDIKNRKCFNLSVLCCSPRQYIKQKIKENLKRLKIIFFGGG